MSNIWSIFQLVTYIKNQLNNDFTLNNIFVQGEVGNFVNHGSGHWYFSLKDDKALINCTMFKGYNSTVKQIPKNGDSVIVQGNLNIFERSGQLQILVFSLEMAGVGDFYQQFEKTKAKLAPLGYFDPQHKKSIPKFPKQISCVTGANTAALQDIKITLAKRWPVKLIQVNAIVQGSEAVSSVVKALQIADGQNSDVIILARGGGSNDDLWCFNSEEIAKAIYDCVTPVITGIGHQIDTTICDLVADYAAATPTAAAIQAAPNYLDVLETVNNYQTSITKYYTNKINEYIQTVDYYLSKLTNYRSTIVSTNSKLQNYRHILALTIMKRIDEARNKTEYSTQLLNHQSKLIFQKKLNDLTNASTLLDSLSPLKTIQRGYIISKQDDKILKSVTEIDESKLIQLTYYDGKVNVKKMKE